jgi:ribosomal protein L4
MEKLELASRNIPGVKTLRVEYLNPEDVVGAWNLVFVGDSINKTTEMLKCSKSSPVSSEK